MQLLPSQSATYEPQSSFKNPNYLHIDWLMTQIAVDAKKTPSYSSDLHFLGIIM